MRVVVVVGDAVLDAGRGPSSSDQILADLQKLSKVFAIFGPAASASFTKSCRPSWAVMTAARLVRGQQGGSEHSIGGFTENEFLC